jgi:putative transposase
MTQRLLQGKYQYRRRLPHYQKDDRALFVTFCCGCLDPLPDSARDIVLRHCQHDQGTKAVIHAVVVMPDHVHLLLTPLRDLEGNVYSLVGILQAIKSASAHHLNRVLGRSGPVWQEESFDHVLRGEESFEEKLEYIREPCAARVGDSAGRLSLVVGGLKIKSNTNVKSSGRGRPLHTSRSGKGHAHF